VDGLPGRSGLARPRPWLFAWHSPGAIAWRKRVGELGKTLGVVDMDGIRNKLGSKWAYRLRKNITLGSEEDWALLLAVLTGCERRNRIAC
jgi:hypothetical protein